MIDNIGNGILNRKKVFIYVIYFYNQRICTHRILNMLTNNIYVVLVYTFHLPAIINHPCCYFVLSIINKKSVADYEIIKMLKNILEYKMISLIIENYIM